MRTSREPIAVILAGGSGRRIGGAKATVNLQGRPLISYPLDAARQALREVAILAKADTVLPSLPGVAVWIEPDSMRHPLIGLRQALALAGGRPVLACAADLPFVTPELIRRIAFADPGPSAAVVASSAGSMQPLLGCYRPRALYVLSQLEGVDDTPLRATVAALEPVLLEVDDPDELFNVNSPDDLLQAAAMLDRRRARPPGPTPK